MPGVRVVGTLITKTPSCLTEAIHKCNKDDTSCIFENYKNCIKNSTHRDSEKTSAKRGSTLLSK